MNKDRAQELNKAAKEVLMDFSFGAPHSPGWAKVYVEAEQPIPKLLTNEFIDELVSDDLEYRRELEESVRWFGVKWS